jgi:hypothetical protein
MDRFTRKRRSPLPTTESPEGSDSDRMEKDNPHDPEQVTLKQRIKQYVAIHPRQTDQCDTNQSKASPSHGSPAQWQQEGSPPS